MRVFDVMTSPARTVAADASAASAWELMRLHGVRHLVVENSGKHVVGVLAASDLGGRHGAAVRENRRVSDLMTEKVIVGRPDTTVRDAANLMRGRAINCLPVFDSDDRLVGSVTTTDLLELLGRGAERPSAAATRAVLRDRGVKPRQASARARSAGVAR